MQNMQDKTQHSLIFSEYLLCMLSFNPNNKLQWKYYCSFLFMEEGTEAELVQIIGLFGNKSGIQTKAVLFPLIIQVLKQSSVVADPKADIFTLI